MEKERIIKGAFILTGANVITRILGFFYRVYMADTIGAEGMGLYQLIMPVYMLVWSITSSGFSTAVSKLTAAENAVGRSPRPILFSSAAISVSLSVLIGVTMHRNADAAALYFLNDARCALSLRLISFCFPFMALGSCIRGYFFGMQHSLPPAVSQVAEQITRMAVIFAIGSLLIPRGIEYACAAAVVGMCAGEIVSCIYVVLCCFGVRKKRAAAKALSCKAACKAILAMAVPLTMSRLISSLFSTLENILMPSRLILSGLDKTAAVSEFGRLTGMAMPLLMFPSSFLTAVSITIVPAISEACEKHSRRGLKSTAEKSMLFAAVTGFGASALFIALPHEISALVYGDSSVGDILFMLGFLCPFMYLNVILTGILNGLGEQNAIFANGLAGSLICLMFVLFAVPRLGVYGSILGSLVSMAITASLNVYRVGKNTEFSINGCDILIKPLLCALFCILSVSCIKSLVAPLICPNAATLLLAIAECLIFCLLLLATGAVSIADVRSLLLPRR